LLLRPVPQLWGADPRPDPTPIYNDDSLARIFLRVDLGHVALVEERGLQGTPSANARIAGPRRLLNQSSPLAPGTSHARVIVAFEKNPLAFTKSGSWHGL
jgi:hypothetical protein